MVNLGDTVKDSVTGFTGIVVSKTDFIHGCTRVGVQPKVSKDGKVPEMQAFDEPALIIIKKATVKRSHNNTGGPKLPVAQARVPSR